MYINLHSSLPLQPGNTCPYAQRTHIVLSELGLPFDVTEVSGMPKVCIYESIFIFTLLLSL